MLKRAQVLMVFYDLPVTGKKEVRLANNFRKDLKRLGFVCIQKSVYAKIVVDRAMMKSEESDVKKHAPQTGYISAVKLSLSDFTKMVTISGEPFNMSLFSDEVIEI